MAVFFFGERKILTPIWHEDFENCRNYSFSRAMTLSMRLW